MQDDISRDWALRCALRPIELADKPIFDAHFSVLRRPLSDYTFSQIFTWRNSLRLLWRLSDDHLCVFANGSGDLTLLLPPISLDRQGPSEKVIDDSFELMDDYNTRHRVSDRSRIEYVSGELLSALRATGLHAQPMGHDYVYDTRRMIDLAGGDLKSKRQERGRFVRDNQFSVAAYDTATHLTDCIALLNRWKLRQDASHETDPGLNAIKRQRETLATELALRHADALGLRGMVVHVAGQLAAFTFGERLGDDQASVVIEKTDLSIKGLAQFIFSEFCRTCWADRPLINAGDDWGLESLAWTKASYRPVDTMQKFVLTRRRAAQVVGGYQPGCVIRPASASDVDAVARLEASSFATFQLNARRLAKLQRDARATFLVAEREGAVVGEMVMLHRRHRGGVTVHLYSLAVTEEQRGRGIGRMLVEESLRACVALGGKQIILQVEKSNVAAIELYRRHDFRDVRVLPDFYGSGRDGMLMACPLDRLSAGEAQHVFKPAA